MRSFSGFEAMFRKNMAKKAPTEILIKKKMREGLSKDEVRVAAGDGAGRGVPRYLQQV